MSEELTEQRVRSKSNSLSAEQIAAIAASAAASVNADKAANSNEAMMKINSKINTLQAKQQQYAAKIKYEMEHNINCTSITIPEMFKKWQPSFTAVINGCTINIPADGRPRKIHNDFAVIINRRMKRLSEKVAKMSEVNISEYRNY